MVNAGLYVSPVGRPFRLGGHARGCRQQGEGQNKGHGYYAWHAAPPEVRFSDTMGRLRAVLSVAEQKRPKLTGDGGEGIGNFATDDPEHPADEHPPTWNRCALQQSVRKEEL